MSPTCICNQRVTDNTPTSWIYNIINIWYLNYFRMFARQIWFFQQMDRWWPGAFSFRFESPLPPLLGANPERRQSEPRANPEWKQSSFIIIPKRTKIRVQLLRKIIFDFVYFCSENITKWGFLMVVKRENTSNIWAGNGCLGTMPYVT